MAWPSVIGVERHGEVRVDSDANGGSRLLDTGRRLPPAGEDE